MRVNNTYQEKTEYRTFAVVSNKIERTYLQFKEAVSVRCFPLIWRTKMVDCWHYIPNKEQYINSYVSKLKCPVTLDVDSENMIFGTEEELNNFKKSYPNIDLYFDAQNIKRALYMDRKEKEAKKKQEVIHK